MPAYAEKALEEVIVTAQKKDDTLQTVPMTVNAVTSEAIAKYNLLDFKDIQSVTPGLTIKAQDTRTSTIAMRGVNVLTDTGYGPGVAIYWNEVNYDIDSAFKAMYDIGQIEVLRGPQGTLRGITAPAGAVTITSKMPNLQNVEGTVEQSFGERSLSNSQFGVSLPIIPDKLGVRVAGLYDYNRDSDIKNITTGQTNSNLTRSGRITVDFRPIDDLEVALIHQYQESNNSGSEAVFGCGQGNVTTCIDKFDRESVDAGPKTDTFNRRVDTALRIEWSLGDYELTSITGYRDQGNIVFRNLDIGNVIPPNNAFDPGPNPASTQQVASNLHTLTQEIRFGTSNSDFYNWVYGVYGSKIVANTFVNQATGGLQAAAFTDISVINSSEEYAVFSNQSFQFTDKLEAQVGLRYQSKRNTTALNGSTLVPTFSIVIPTAFPESGGAAVATDEGVTGSASVSYQLTDDVRTYLSYGHSFRSGGFTVATSTPGDLTQYQPETSDSIELGFKSRFANGRLQVNGDIYYQKYHDFLARTSEAIVSTKYSGGTSTNNSAAGGDFLNYNADATVSGAELQMDQLITDDWQAGLGVSYTDAKFNNGGHAYCNVRDASGAIIPPSGGVEVNLCDAHGRLSGEPNWGVTASSEYTMHFGALDAFTRGLYTFASGRTDESIPNSVLDTNSYGVFNLFVGVRDINKVWEVTAWAKNLFDHQQAILYSAELQSSGLLSGYSRIQTIPERQFGITGKYNFSM
ncbi:MAG TPA: TonB-dependent receptor [Spongiibacteraceae bacterium]|nr:TonB-dependent receptor [Spongiibacteraceae bacterium]